MRSNKFLIAKHSYAPYISLMGTVGATEDSLGGELLGIIKGAPLDCSLVLS